MIDAFRRVEEETGSDRQRDSVGITPSIAQALQVVWAATLLWHAGFATAAGPEVIVDSYEDGADVHTPRPFRRSPVRTVVIEENAAKSAAGQGAPDDCGRFVVTEAQVKQYFARARTVSQRAYSHDLDWSPCVASGTLTLADGRQAQWGVQQYGLGWLYIDHRRTYFHCRRCSLVNLGVPLPPK